MTSFRVLTDTVLQKEGKRAIRKFLNGKEYSLREVTIERGAKEVMKDDGIYPRVESVPDGTWTIRFGVREVEKK